MKNMKLELEMLEEIVAPGSARDFVTGFLTGVAIVGSSATIINFATGGALMVALT